MLRLGNTIRLTAREIQQFRDITGFEPRDVRSLRDLDAYVALCKRYYRGRSRELRTLRQLIDHKHRRCMRAVD